MSPSQRVSWRRIALRAALIGALAALLLPVAGRLLLELPGVRRSILSRVSDLTEARLGVAVDAVDFRAEVLAGRLEVFEVSVRASGSETDLATVERIAVEVALRPLLRRRVEVESLLLERPIVDLSASLPTFEPTDDAGGSSEVVVHSVRITDGRLRSPEAATADAWLRGWEATGIELDGSWLATGWAARLSAAEVAADLAEIGPWSGQLSVTGTGTGSRFDLDALELHGPGVDLSGSVDGGVAADDPLGARFDLALALDTVLPRSAPGGALTARGELDLRALAGSADLEVRDVPLSILEPWVARERLAELGVAGTLLDLETRLEAPSGEAMLADGSISWRRGTDVLVDARMDLRAPRRSGSTLPDPMGVHGSVDLAASDFPVDLVGAWLGREVVERSRLAGTRLDVEGSITSPAAGAAVEARADLRWARDGEALATAGLNAVSERLDASPWLDLESVRGSARVESPEIPGALVAELVEVPETVAPLVRDGSFEVILAAASDAQGDLSGDGSLRWSLDGRRLVDLEAALLPGSRLDRLGAIAFEAVALSAEPGTRRARGTLRFGDEGSPQLADTIVDLATEDLGELLAEIAGLSPAWVPQALLDQGLPGALSARLGLGGPPSALDADLEATWRPAAESVVGLVARGSLAGPTGTLDLTLDRVPLALLSEGTGGHLSGTVVASGRLEDYSSDFALRLEDLPAVGELTAVDSVVLEGDLDVEAVRIRTFRARLGDRLVSATGSLSLPDPLEQLLLQVELERPVGGIDFLALEVALTAGVLHVDSREVRSRLGAGQLSLTVPLASIAGQPAVPEWLRPRLETAAAGPIEAFFDFPGIELAGLMADMGLAAPTRLQLDLTGRASLDPDDPGAATAELDLSNVVLVAEDRRFESTLLPLRLDGRELTLRPSSVSSEGESLEVRGRAGLVLQGETEGAPPELTDIDLEASGSLSATLLNPFLAGGSAIGSVGIEASVAGPPSQLRGRIRIDGRDAAIRFARPYATRFEDVQVALVLDPEGLQIESAGAALNEGRVSATGHFGWAGNLDVETTFDDVRYRLDYGLSTVLSGQLELDVPTEGRGLLSGALDLERGSLRRDIDLERELRRQFLAPPALTGTQADLYSRIDVDLQVTTTEGVRVRNNVGDLRARWAPLEVRGTMAEPILDGRIEVEPGGLFFAFGQIARLESGSLTFTGEPGVAPRLDMNATTSLEDASLVRSLEPGAALWMQDSMSGGPGDTESQQGTLGTGLAGYLGSQLTSSVGGPLSRTEISTRPLLVFGETDPATRLTVSVDLSPHVALATSVNLREAESQTYVLDLHQLGPRRDLRTQVFTNDEDGEGATLQQVLEFLGSRADADRPLLRRLVFEPPPGVSRRGIQRSLALRSGEPVPDGVVFEAEVDVEDYLRFKGYPGARVQARLTSPPGKEGRVDLELDIQSGPLVTFRFTGIEPDPAFRSSITSLYRIDFYEAASIEEMRDQALRVLLASGYLDAEVEIRVPPPDAAGNRTVEIASSADRRVRLQRPRIEGLPPEDAARLADRFEVPLRRAELAAERPDAVRFLLDSISALGYRDARIEDMDLREDGVLVVRVDAGPRRNVAAIETTGFPDDLQPDLDELPLQTGAAARADVIALTSSRLEGELRDAGYADATVRSLVRDGAGGAGQATVIFEATPGEVVRVSEVQVEGARSVRPRWVERVADLEQGTPLSNAKLATAQRDLFRTGLFDSVGAAIDRELEDGPASVTLRIRELPRVALSYGLRWASDDGGAVVFDVADHNVDGRGLTLGLRALVSADDDSVRLYSRYPRLFRTKASLELFLESRRERSEGLLTESLESTLQLSFPLGRRSTGRTYGRWRERRVTEEEPSPFFPIDITITSPFLGFQYIHDSRDSPIDATRGRFTSLDLSGSEEFLGSDFDYVRFFAWTSLFRRVGRVGGRPLVWAHSYRLGLAEPFSGQVLIPDEQIRFFAGGAYSVRGYATESLGPVSDLFGPSGGEALLVINQELRLAIPAGLTVVAFVDAGNVWAERRDIGTDLRSALGLGLRWASPIGLLRVDLARPLNRRPNDSDWEAYFGFGHVF